jgi:hypothetical protein
MEARRMVVLAPACPALEEAMSFFRNYFEVTLSSRTGSEWARRVTYFINDAPVVATMIYVVEYTECKTNELIDEHV